MKKEHRYRIAMCECVLQFGHRYQEELPPGSPAGRILEDIAVLAERLRGAAATQLVNARLAATTKLVARRRLRLHLKTIARIAREIAITSPGFDDVFVPARRHGDVELMVTAHAFIRAAEPVAARFIAQGMPEDFVDALRAALVALDEALDDRVHGLIARVAAHADTAVALNEALSKVRTLDALMKYRFADRPEMLAVWRRAKYIGGRPSREASRAALPETTSTALISAVSTLPVQTPPAADRPPLPLVRTAAPVAALTDGE